MRNALWDCMSHDQVIGIQTRRITGLITQRCCVHKPLIYVINAELIRLISSSALNATTVDPITVNKVII